MRVLVLGSGAREHALAARLAAERDVGEIMCAPGNPGIARIARTIPADLTDLEAIAGLAEREQVDFTVVGPELPLSLGVADRFAAAGLLLLGPTAEAARLESSKAFAKGFMARHSVPTARFHTSDALDDALAVVRSNEFGWPIVLKADGLAAGKGVVIAEDSASAETALAAAMGERRFGAAGDRVVIEECLTGPEVSFFVVTDGARALPIGSAQDHKRVFDDDRGPNTGGMGAFAPSPLVDRALETRVMHEIVEPVIAGMAAVASIIIAVLLALSITATDWGELPARVRLATNELSRILFTDAGNLLPFEVIGVLLLAAVIGGVYLAKREPGGPA